MSTVVTSRRIPTVDEYADLIRSVGWKPRDPEAVKVALANSLFSVVASSEEVVVGMGRVIGDGGLHYYVSDVVVRPEFQRRGVGSAIVRILQGYVERVPYQNTLVGVVATGGSRKFYARLGFKAQGSDGAAMYRWLNAASSSPAATSQRRWRA